MRGTKAARRRGCHGRLDSGDGRREITLALAVIDREDSDCGRHRSAGVVALEAMAFVRGGALRTWRHAGVRFPAPHDRIKLPIAM
jgi:hypothetical protein